MSTRRAVAYTVLAFAAMFAFQLLWTAGRLDQLRELGRRGLRRRGGSGGALGGSRLDRLALDANRGVGSGDGHTPGAVGKQQQQQNVAAGGVARWSGGAAPMPDPALIVFCFNRSDYLNQTLHSLLGLRGLDRYTVYVSQVRQRRVGWWMRGGWFGEGHCPSPGTATHLACPLLPAHRTAMRQRWQRWWAHWPPTSCALPAAFPFGRKRRGWQR